MDHVGYTCSDYIMQEQVKDHWVRFTEKEIIAITDDCYYPFLRLSVCVCVCVCELLLKRACMNVERKDPL